MLSGGERPSRSFGRNRVCRQWGATPNCRCTTTANIAFSTSRWPFRALAAKRSLSAGYAPALRPAAPMGYGRGPLTNG